MVIHDKQKPTMSPVYNFLFRFVLDGFKILSQNNRQSCVFSQQRRLSLPTFREHYSPAWRSAVNTAASFMITLLRLHSQTFGFNMLSLMEWGEREQSPRHRKAQILTNVISSSRYYNISIFLRLNSVNKKGKKSHVQGHMHLGWVVLLV